MDLQAGLFEADELGAGVLSAPPAAPLVHRSAHAACPTPARPTAEVGATRSRAILRVGIPQPGGKILAAARASGYPVLFSANAFMVRDKDGYGDVVRVRKPDPAQFAGLDAALDSAGFVAMSHYRGFPWSVDQYLDLVASWPWSWWSSMDLCVEPELAHDRVELYFRLAETCRLLGECRQRARDRGIPDPMPILQGRHPRDYLWMLERLPLLELPPLIGVGSMCRRHVHGPDGLIAVVQALDRELPAQVRLHLFGVKGTALSYLSGHPRLASIDSMAWDAAARRSLRTGRTAEARIGFMHAWTRAHGSRLDERAPSADEALFFDEVGAPSDELMQWLDLVLDNELEGPSAAWHASREWMTDREWITG